MAEAIRGVVSISSVKGRRKAWILLLTALVLAAGGDFMSRLFDPATSRFEVLGSDERIGYEPGAQAMAVRVAAFLPESLEQVERAQYGPFIEAPKIFICSTIESYRDRVEAKDSVAETRGGTIFVSPRIFDRADTAQAIVTHELSHLHFYQRGRHDYCALFGTPTWFHEGLATLVSGGGVGNVTRDEAVTALLAGRRFEPVTRDGWLFRTSADTYGLDPHMFYRQSALFVGYLRARDPAAFRALLGAMEAGCTFRSAFAQSYRQSMDVVWGEFLASLRRARAHR
jgi:hypothetical protein